MSHLRARGQKRLHSVADALPDALPERGFTKKQRKQHDRRVLMRGTFCHFEPVRSKERVLVLDTPEMTEASKNRLLLLLQQLLQPPLLIQPPRPLNLHTHAKTEARKHRNKSHRMMKGQKLIICCSPSFAHPNHRISSGTHFPTSSALHHHHNLLTFTHTYTPVFRLLSWT